MATIPFLKWPGGKRELLPIIKPHFPSTFEGFLEPFVGSGAAYFDLQPNCPLIADASLRLVNAYRAVRNHVESVIEVLHQYKYDQALYYAVRESGVIDSENIVEAAAALIFMNKTGYNGLYRVNNSGDYNVPFGRYKRVRICNESQLRACSAALQAASIEHASFEDTLTWARPGDFAYCDPPYVPVNKNSFDKYLPGGFALDDQVRLRDLAVDAKRQGVHVLISNSDCRTTRELYAGPEFRIIELEARRSIAANAKHRGPAPELLLANY
jgi:DNA adenine methylase